MSMLFLILSASHAFAEPVVHRAAVRIDPFTSTIEVVDTLWGPFGSDGISFALHRSLRLEASEGMSFIDPDTTTDWDVPSSTTRVVRLPSGISPPLVLRYAGTIRHELEPAQNYARGFATTAGIIDSCGVFLSGASSWLPCIPGASLLFTLHVTVPPGWDCVSQGIDTRQGSTITWRCTQPMEEAYLVAGRFFRYARDLGAVEAQAYLLFPDSSLASTYLEATARYLTLYDSLIGPYPYEKFALVENFWETGYGMPSFTLLGSAVIRLPFIVDFSYGHEILHNWFGNGVYVDDATGNWCEGLTAYLADHLYKEWAGQDASYRLNQLQHYRWYAAGRGEIPLRRFIERDSPETEAIGYGKGAMVFHMLRRRLGDKAFFAALREFYRTRLFTRASWDDLAEVFSGQGSFDCSACFSQWVDWVGAPRLSLLEASPSKTGLRLVVAQDEPPYELDVPVDLLVASDDSLHTRHLLLPMHTARLDTVVAVDGVVGVSVDPRFDVFRLLRPSEAPPGIGRFLADSVNVVASAFDSVIVSSWPARGPARVIPSTEEPCGLTLVCGFVLPPHLMERFFHGRLEAQGQTLVAAHDTLPPSWTVIAAGEEEESALCWIRPGSTASPATLAQVFAKLVHYDTYSLLAFEGVRCVLKKTFPPFASPLSLTFGPGASR